MRAYRHALLTPAVGLAALAGSILLPAAASAQLAGTPVTPTITVVLSPTSVDYGHQSVSASGTVSTSTGPVANAPVTVGYENVSSQAAHISLTTGTNGSYSGTIPDPATAAQVVTATVSATSSTTTASASAKLGFTKDPVTITASFAQPYVNAGSSDTLSGVASYVSGGTSHPLANSQLSITFTYSGGFDFPPVSATVETAADGSFSYVVPENSLAVLSVEVTVNSAATPYLDAGQVSLSFLVNQAAQFDQFTGTVSADRVLRFLACAGIPEPLAASQLVGPVDYQYSTGPNGPWKALGTSKFVANGPCYLGNSLGDGTYTGKFTAPLANAYYRAYAPAVPGQMSAVSQVIHLQRYPTRITGFTITPRRVRHGGKVTVSGRLWQLNRQWLPDASRQIVIEFRYRGKTYTLRTRLTTNFAGRFRGTFAVPRTAAWLALYKGSKNQFAAATRAISVRVR